LPAMPVYPLLQLTSCLKWHNARVANWQLPRNFLLVWTLRKGISITRVVQVHAL